MKSTERFEKVNIDRLVPYARNARTHSKEQILQLRSSLREFGFVNPVIVDKDLNIIAGHGRIMAAREEGLTEIPCVFVEHLTEAQKRAYILADNRLALNAGWDEELLALEFADLKELGFDLEITGFDADEIEKLFADPGGDVADDDFDLTAALEQAAFVLPGDVWTLGRHRLICGDATVSETVKKLMDGRKANLVLTDPPYNVSFESVSGLKIKNDSMKAEQFYIFLLSAFKNLYENLADGGAFYCFHSDSEKVNFFRACVDAGFHYRNKAVFVMNDATVKAIRKLKDGQGQYLWQPSLQAGTPDTILNRPVYTSAYVPTIAAAAKTIVFGDFSYYWVADRQGRVFKRLNELFAVTGQVGFVATQRVDGKLILPEAIKVLQQKA